MFGLSLRAGPSLFPMGERVQAAQAEAVRRLHRQRSQFWPTRLLVVAIVVVTALTSNLPAGLAGRRLAITLCLVIFGLGVLCWPRAWLRPASVAVQTVELVVIGTAGVALAFLQPKGASELPGSVAVFIAGVGLPRLPALGVGLAVTAGIGIALGPVAHTGAGTVAACVLLCAVLGLTGALLHSSRLSQDRTELLLAELEEARDDQARAAAAAERANIARELHDVLAHSLSGLSIQLEGARKLASKDGAGLELRHTIDRAAALAKQGLVEARQAVGALRQEQPVGVDRLPELVEHFRRDVGLEVSFKTSGEPRALGPEASLTLYRVLGEALTNVARHAPQATTYVELCWQVGQVRLEVLDSGGGRGPATSEGGGWGLVGVAERVKQLGGQFLAGPSGTGWSVVVTVPT